MGLQLLSFTVYEVYEAPEVSSLRNTAGHSDKVERTRHRLRPWQQRLQFELYITRLYGRTANSFCLLRRWIHCALGKTLLFPFQSAIMEPRALRKTRRLLGNPLLASWTA